MSAFHYGDNQHKADGKPVIDFRSDTVTKPCAAMREAMAKAEVGDDVYEDDMTVKTLEQDVADMLGKEAGLYVPTGTMSNLIAVMSHCQRGEEIILADQYHIAIDEASGASVLGSVAIHPLLADERGAITPEQVRNAIKPDDSHYAISKLVGLENTVSGRIQDQQNIDAIVQVAKQANLNVHMDGARLLNAAVAQDLPPARLVQDIDSVSLCLSKGLGAPMGSVLSGDAAFIRRGRRLRKMLGAGMRQVGIVAAAGSYALANNVARLVDDHRRAKELANGLQGIAGLQVDLQKVETNMLFMQSTRMIELGDYLASKGIIVSAFSDQCRVVTHKDIDDEAVALLQQHIQDFFAS